MKAEPEVEQRDSVNVSDRHSNAPAHSTARHAAHLLFIVLAVGAFFWRIFFLGETLIDVATLNNQLPWGYDAGQSDYPYNRRDLTDTYVTRDYFVASAYRDGEFPLWNPYTMAGHPIYADGVTRTLSPFLLFYKFFDVPLGYSLARITELMLAAIFMYLFLVAIGASAGGGLMGSLVFAFSAHSMLHLTGLGWWGGFLWLPLILMFVDRAVVGRSYVPATAAGVFLAAQFFCGYLPNQIYYVGAVVLYYLFFGVVRRGSRGSIRKPLIMMALTLATGLVLSATQWVPALELLSHSNRKIVGAELGYVYLPPWYALTLVFPNFFGAAYDAKALTLFTAVGVSHDHILYLGIAALLPLGFTLYWLRVTGKSDEREELRSPDRDRAVFFTGLAGLSLIIMMSAPLYVPITRFIPVLQVIRVAVRAGVLFLLSASVLVAFGADLLLAQAVGLRDRFGVVVRKSIIAALALVMLGVIGSYSIKLSGIAAETGERGRLAFIRRAAFLLSEQFTPPNSSILIPLGCILATGALFWSLTKNRLSGQVFLTFMIGLLMVDLYWNSGQFNRSFDRWRVFPRTEITSLLQSLPPGRVLVTPSDLETNRRVSSETPLKIIAPPNTLLPYQVSTVTGKNQQFPRWYREYASLIEPQPNLSHVVFDQYRSPFLDLLNVRYVMTHESAPPLEGYDAVASAEGVSVYENKRALPRAFFATSVVAAGSAASSLAMMREPNFDPRKQTVIEAPGFEGSSGAGVAAVIEDRRNRVVIETDNERDGLLVLSDNFYPGWRAYVDGSRVELFRANHTMRAVKVPAGRHVVSFAFMPAAFFTSLYVSLGGVALTFSVLMGHAIKRRRERTPRCTTR
jgi:hypothetical protein